MLKVISAAGRIEHVARDQTLAVGKQLLQRTGQCLGARSRQQTALGAYEQRIAEQVAQARQHPADRRLCVAEPRGCSRDTALVE